MRPLGLGMSFSRILQSHGKATPTLRTLPGSGRSLTSLALPEAALKEAATASSATGVLAAASAAARTARTGAEPPRAALTFPSAGAAAGASAGGDARADQADDDAAAWLKQAAAADAGASLAESRAEGAGAAQAALAVPAVARALPPSRRVHAMRPPLKRSLSVNEGLDFFDDFDALVAGNLVGDSPPPGLEPREDLALPRRSAAAHAAQRATPGATLAPRLGYAADAHVLIGGEGPGGAERDLGSLGFELDIPGLALDDSDHTGGALTGGGSGADVGSALLAPSRGAERAPGGALPPAATASLLPAASRPLDVNPDSFLLWPTETSATPATGPPQQAAVPMTGVQEAP